LRNPHSATRIRRVGTSRDVRAACSGATPSNTSFAQIFVPPPTTRPGTARRAVLTNALNTYFADGIQLLLKTGSATVPVAPVGVPPTESSGYVVHLLAIAFCASPMFEGKNNRVRSLISGAGADILPSQIGQKPFEKPSRKCIGRARSPNAPMPDNEKRV